MVDLSYGQSMSGSVQVGRSLPLQMQNYGLAIDYTRDLSRGIIRVGAEKYSLGLGIYTAQVSYKAGEGKSTGGNFFMTVRTGWMSLLSNKTWLVTVTPEFILLSRMSVASYSQSTIDGEKFQSASLSSYSGNGSIRLPFYVGKKMNWRMGQSDLFIGASFSTLMQNFSSKKDTVVATSPSTGKVTSLEKTSQGSYQLRAFSLQLHLSFVM